MKELYYDLTADTKKPVLKTYEVLFTDKYEHKTLKVILESIFSQISPVQQIKSLINEGFEYRFEEDFDEYAVYETWKPYIEMSDNEDDPYNDDKYISILEKWFESYKQPEDTQFRDDIPRYYKPYIHIKDIIPVNYTEENAVDINEDLNLVDWGDNEHEYDTDILRFGNVSRFDNANALTIWYRDKIILTNIMKDIKNINDTEILINNIIKYIPGTKKIKKAFIKEWKEICSNNTDEEDLFDTYIKDELEQLLAEHLNINIRPENIIWKYDANGKIYSVKLRRVINGTVEEIFQEVPDLNGFYTFIKEYDTFKIKITDYEKIPKYIESIVGGKGPFPIYKITLV